MTILNDFCQMMNDPDEDIRLDVLISTDREKSIYEKWVQIFNSVTPFNIPQGVALISSSFKMGKRDCIIFLAYMKFFEQRLQTLKRDDGSMPSPNEMMAHMMNAATEEGGSDDESPIYIG